MNITDGSHRTKYYLSGDVVTLKDNGTDKIYYTYDADGDLISMNLNGKEYFYIRNVQNDVIGLHDSEGKVVVSYSYDTWGNIVSITGSLKDSVGVKNPYRYRGYRYDEETGLYYLQSRYYNAEWGRFINGDNYGGTKGEILSHNVFAYCLNNPVNMEDGSGCFALPIALGILAVASVVTTAIVVQNHNNKTIKGTRKDSKKNTITSFIVPTNPRDMFKKSIQIAAQTSLLLAKRKSKTKEKSKAKAVTKESTKKQEPKYWEASRNVVTDKIVIGNSISMNQAKLRIKTNQSVMCIDNISATALVIGEPDAFYESKHKNLPGYYNHYHVYKNHGDPHIWFYGN